WWRRRGRARAAPGGGGCARRAAQGPRLEIGDFTFKTEIAKEGFTLAAATKRSAFVIAAGDADPFVQETLPKKETRVEFDFGLTATQDGISVDGGGRLSTTISLNTTVGPITVNSLQLALQPEAKPGASELRFDALASIRVDIGPLHVVVEQIGATVDLGST